MTFRRIGTFVVVLIAVGLLGGRAFLQRRRALTADVENLRSVPYASWTSAKATGGLSGVVRYDPRRASPGYNVFTDDHTRAFLMDLQGRVVHEWDFGDVKKCEFVRIFPNGDALGVCVAQCLRKVDKNSNAIWTFSGMVNHDVDVAPDGSLITSRIFGSSKYKGRTIPKEGLTFLSSDGKMTGQWSLWGTDGPALRNYHRPSPLDVPAVKGAADVNGRYDFYHLNSVQSLPDTPLARTHPEFSPGNILLSMRNTDLICILDKKTHKVVWSWGPGVLDGQHAPVMLKNGNILIFDNGTRRLATRILELDPVTRKIVWRYPKRDDPKFFSAWRGNAQRLDNGNTLICEAEKGHAFEVTPDGTIVWDYWNPFLNDKGDRLRIYRMNRVTLDPSAFSSGQPKPIESFPPPRSDTEPGALPAS